MYMTLEPPSPDTSGKQQEGVGEVKKGKRKKNRKSERTEYGNGQKERKERKQVICAIKKHYSSDFPLLLMAWISTINLTWFLNLFCFRNNEGAIY